MDYRITFEDGSDAYLMHYGVKGMKWRKHLKAATDEEESKSRATAIIEDLVGRARQKLDDAGSHLPENPLYRLKVKSEQMERSGESAAARQRLKDRYSSEGKGRYNIRLG